MTCAIPTWLPSSPSAQASCGAPAGRAQASQVARALTAGRNLSGPRLSDGAPALAPCSHLEYQDQGKAREEAPQSAQVTLQAAQGPKEVVRKKHFPFPPPSPSEPNALQASTAHLHTFTDNPGVYLFTHLSTRWRVPRGLGQVLFLSACCSEPGTLLVLAEYFINKGEGVNTYHVTTGQRRTDIHTHQARGKCTCSPLRRGGNPILSHPARD